MSCSIMLTDQADFAAQFDDQEIVHQYDRKGHEHAIHTSRTHNANGEIEYGSHRTTSPMTLSYGKSPSEEKSGHSFFGARPFKTFRRQTSGAGDEEEGMGRDDLASVPLTPTGMVPHGILETTVHLEPPVISNKSALDSSSIRPSFHTLLNKFASADGPDLRLHSGSRRGSAATVKEKEEVDPVRGGGRRGTKDYPHLKKSAAEQEQEERRALVTGGGDDEGSGPDAQETDEEEGMVSPVGVDAELIGVRRLPDIPRDSPTYPPAQR